MKKNSDLGLLILRLSLGILMLLHGIAKLEKGPEFIEGMLSEKGIPGFLAYGVYIGEILAPIALIIGFRTRLASIFYIITCITAIWLVHSDEIFTLGKHGGWAIELLGLYLFGALALFFTGSGKLALSSHHRWD